MKENLLFVSAGDNAQLIQWIGKRVNYDLYVIYYGDNHKQYKKMPWLECRKGSKFQNFKYFYQTYPEIINNYERFFILDDDFVMNLDQINELFEFSYEYDLDICGPSLHPASKVSHQLTRNNPKLKLAYTNFVEVGAMLFSKKALVNLMNNLSYDLIGWGIDYLAVWSNGINKKNKYAICHTVKAVNPDDVCKGGKKELSYVNNWQIREQIWKEYSQKIGCPTEYELKEYRKIPKKLFNQ